MAESMAPHGTEGRIFANVVRLIGGKAVAGLLSLVYLVVASRALGPRDYGVLILVHGFAVMVGGIAEFPGWHTVVRYGVPHAQDGNQAALVRLLRFVGAIELSFGVVAVIAAAILGPIIGPRIGWSAEATAFAVPYSLAVLYSIRTTPAGYLQLARRFDLLGLHNLVSPVMRCLGAAIVILADGGLRGFLWAWLVAALAEWLSLWIMGILVFRRNMPGAGLFGKLSDVRGEAPGILPFMLAANADSTLGELAGRLAPLIIGAILGPAAAGLYSVAQRTTVIIAEPARLLGQASYSELARLAASDGGRRQVPAALMRTAGIALIGALPLAGLIAAFATPVAVLFAGESFAAAGSILGFLAFARAILVITPPSSGALVAMGRPSLSVMANAATGFGLVLVLPFILETMGLKGIGYYAIAQALASAGLLTILVRRTSRE